MMQLVWIGVGSVVVVMATGAGRTLTHVEGYYNPKAERLRRRALIIKHVLPVAIFGSGIAWPYAMDFC